MVKITESKGAEGIKYRAVFEIIKENGKRDGVQRWIPIGEGSRELV